MKTKSKETALYSVPNLINSDGIIDAIKQLSPYKLPGVEYLGYSIDQGRLKLQERWQYVGINSATIVIPPGKKIYITTMIISPPIDTATFRFEVKLLIIMRMLFFYLQELGTYKYDFKIPIECEELITIAASGIGGDVNYTLFGWIE